jgi:hypothetical protein
MLKKKFYNFISFFIFFFSIIKLSSIKKIRKKKINFKKDLRVYFKKNIIFNFTYFEKKKK